MATRSLVAEVTSDGWRGIYCHWGGYPTERGPLLYKLVQEHGPASFIERYIRAHPGGWSDFDESCYCHEKNPAAPPMIYTHEDGPSGQEWAYILSPAGFLTVLSRSRDGDTRPPVGPDDAGMGRHWVFVASVDLTNPEPPDWAAIEEAA